MKYLIETARQYGLDNIAEQALRNPNVHGIIIEVDPLWLHFWKFHIEYPNLKIPDDFYYDIGIRRRLINYSGYNTWTSANSSYFSSQVPFDINWYPPQWEDHLNRNKNNLIVKILLRPGAASLDLKFEEGLEIIQEHAPVPQLSANAKKMLRPIEGGTSIGHLNEPAGTLGGILNDPISSKKYGLTCGHVITGVGQVAEQPSRNDNPHYAALGKCIFNHSPTATGGVLCNPKNKTILNEMDIALVEIDASILSKNEIINIGKINGFMPGNKLHPNLLIEFNGRSSGHKLLVTGGIGLVQEFSDGKGNSYCYSNLVEVKEPLLRRLVFKRPVKSGDSGSWVVVQGPAGNQWCGMIVGENRQTGYAMMSEDILEFLKTKGYDLSCA